MSTFLGEAQIDPADLRRNFGYVPQDVTLFFGSVRDNLVMGSPHADDADILQAAELAGVSEFANRHPLGFDLPVGERGECLSGGQRQTIAIARAILHDPRYMVMDEPTNSMDNSSEEMLKRNLAGYIKNKTFVLVTHRASLLDLVERLIVLDHGKVVADGPKEQVMTLLREGKLRATGNG
jgi:ATP-binding cassette subfamily C protein LapB